MDCWEEQQEELRADRNQLDIFQIICQMEIMFQIVTMKDIRKMISNIMIIYKDLRKANNKMNLDNICQEMFQLKIWEIKKSLILNICKLTLIA
jgi:hypothetical protein